MATEANNPEFSQSETPPLSAALVDQKDVSPVAVSESQLSTVTSPAWLRLSRAKTQVSTFVLRWICLLIIIFGCAFATMEVVHRTPWYRHRLYQKLFSNDAREQERAAALLAHLKCEKELLLALQSDVDSARELGRRALEHIWFNQAGKEAFHLLEQAYDAMEKKEFQRALATLDRIIDRFPGFAEAWNRRAAVYWALAEYEKSLSDSEHALTLNPNHYGAMQGIGVCRLQLGDVAEACRYLRAALKVLPHDESTRRSLEKCEELLRVFPWPVENRKTHDVI